MSISLWLKKPVISLISYVGILSRISGYIDLFKFQGKFQGILSMLDLVIHDSCKYEIINANAVIDNLCQMEVLKWEI